MKTSLSPFGCKYCGNYDFKCGQSVPIYEVSNVHALNQLFGYAKFINQSYGDVYYRGECKLHDSLIEDICKAYEQEHNCSVVRLNDGDGIIIDNGIETLIKGY